MLQSVLLVQHGWGALRDAQQLHGLQRIFGPVQVARERPRDGGPQGHSLARRLDARAVVRVCFVSFVSCRCCVWFWFWFSIKGSIGFQSAMK